MIRACHLRFFGVRACALNFGHRSTIQKGEGYRAENYHLSINAWTPFLPVSGPDALWGAQSGGVESDDRFDVGGLMASSSSDALVCSAIKRILQTAVHCIRLLSRSAMKLDIDPSVNSAG